ncbi:hypothetical protein [Streptomyces axinellae]|uniref:hypothetical protein n=1 Tax=Streptomyces axinellae TaxID=552788 RepID=UPI0031E1886B
MPNWNRLGQSPYSSESEAARSDESLSSVGTQLTEAEVLLNEEWNSSAETLNEPLPDESTGLAWLNQSSDSWTPEQRAEAVLRAMTYLRIGQQPHAVRPAWMNQEIGLWNEEQHIEAAARTIPEWSATANQDASTWTRQQFTRPAPRPEWMKHPTNTWTPEQHQRAARDIQHAMRAVAARSAPPGARPGNGVGAATRPENSMTRSRTQEPGQRRGNGPSGRR